MIGVMYTPLLTKSCPTKRRHGEAMVQTDPSASIRARHPLAKKMKLNESHPIVGNGASDAVQQPAIIAAVSESSSPTTHPILPSANAAPQEKSLQVRHRSLRPRNTWRKRLYHKRKRAAARLKRRCSGKHMSPYLAICNFCLTGRNTVCPAEK